MLPEISKIRGIHPGVILRRELKSSGRKANEFSESIGEYSQTLSAIMKEKRRITPILSLKLAKEFGVAEEYFLILQSLYDIEQLRETSDKKHPNLNLIRKSLFWDTEISKIDWNKMAPAVIKRIFSKGNNLEKEEITKFYGKETVSKILAMPSTQPMRIKNQKT